MSERPRGADGGALLALEEHLRREESRIKERGRELRAARELISSVTSRSLGARDTGTETIPPGDTSVVVDRLLAESVGLVRHLVLSIEQGPALDPSTARARRARYERGGSQRSVYPAEVLATAQGQQWLTVWGGAGEEQRILPTTETEFAVFGESAVIAADGWDHLDAGYVVIRDVLMIRLYTAYFDLAWKHAIPVPSQDDDGAEDPRLVELLRLGLKDEAIARNLGVSLRTVRRRVARLMSLNGVDTRFQLAWVLAGRRH